MDQSTNSQPFDSVKLYSKTSILIATFIGGPAAAGTLMRRNFINLGKKDYGDYSLYLGIGVTILLIIIGILIPEGILDRVATPIIPGLSVGLVYYIIGRFQGKALEFHKLKNGAFYSGWQAAGIGTVFMIAIVAVIAAYVFLGPEEEWITEYDNNIDKIGKNEEKAGVFFELINSGFIDHATKYINQTSIPLFEENLRILDTMDALDGMDIEFIKQNDIIREYCYKKIEYYKLMVKALEENTDKYDYQINDLNMKMEELMGKL